MPAARLETSRVGQELLASASRAAAVALVPGPLCALSDLLRSAGRTGLFFSASECLYRDTVVMVQAGAKAARDGMVTLAIAFVAWKLLGRRARPMLAAEALVAGFAAVA